MTIKHGAGLVLPARCAHELKDAGAGGPELLLPDHSGADETKWRMTVPFEVSDVKADSEGEGTFQGFASTFGNTDLVGDIIEPGAFSASVKQPGKVKMLWGHNPHEVPIGVWTEMEENEKGLFVKGRLLMENSRPREIFNALKAKALDAMSIGFTVPKNGAEFDRESGIRRIKKIDLWEISVVTFPANPKARVGRVKSLDNVETERDFELFLREAGFSRSEAVAIVARAKHALSQRDAGDPGVDPAADVLDALRRNATILKTE